MRLARFFLSLPILIASLPGNAQDSGAVPEPLVRSKYVYVGILRADDGFHGPIDPRTAPDDRKVREEVERAFRGWKRYALTMDPKNADLIVLVRKGRYGSITAGTSPGTIRVGSGPGSNDPAQPDPGINLGGEAGPLRDILEIRTGPTLGEPVRLWRRARKGGLSGTPPSLLEELKDEVEKAAKKLRL